MSLLPFTVFLLLAFAIGYFVVSRLIDSVRGRGHAGADPSRGLPAADDESKSAGEHRRISPIYEGPEARYARVLGLRLPVTAPEIRDRYRALIAQHHPDTVSQIGPELREAADRKIREILEAYEYFRVKYRL